MDIQNEIETIVSESGKGKYSQEIIIGDHILVADESKNNGGNDLGPSPYDFLLAALGSCTSMTLRMYAEYKKIPLEKVIVKLKHGKIHAKDCIDCESNTSKVDLIERKITLIGKLSQEQRMSLLNIADKCPVHRTLQSKITIITELIK